MKEITINEQEKEIVDQEDYERINAFKWEIDNKTGKAKRKDNKTISMADQVLAINKTTHFTICIDGNKLDCRKKNIYKVKRNTDKKINTEQRKTKIKSEKWSLYQSINKKHADKFILVHNYGNIKLSKSMDDLENIKRLQKYSCCQIIKDTIEYTTHESFDCGDCQIYKRIKYNSGKNTSDVFYIIINNNAFCLCYNNNKKHFIGGLSNSIIKQYDENIFEYIKTYEAING